MFVQDSFLHINFVPEQLRVTANASPIVACTQKASAASKSELEVRKLRCGGLYL